MTEPTLDPAGPGAMLRAAREKQGLHIAALAAAIKVSPRKLDALENDRWGELPDATFTRALAQTVCRTLKIDARPVLDKLPPAAAVVLEAQDAGLNAPFRDRPGREEPGLAVAAVRPMVWGAALLMLAALAVYLLPPDLLQRRAPAPAVAASAATPLAQAASAAPAVGGPGDAASAAALALPASAPVFPADAASAPALPGEPVFAAPPLATAQAALPAPPVASAPAPVPGLVQLSATSASWVEARDGRGGTLLSRTVFPGEAVGLDGALPIRLTIGNASATQLGFRGQPVDLAAHTRDNVARVELQ
jgi:cytoskeleton protein RodZ